MNDQNMMNKIGELLLKVEKPCRYVGGEFGSHIASQKKDALLKTIIAFPDLYEIGMGNQALKIIYNRLNNLPDILCDRAFAPAPDFEKVLCENNIPLYGLDTKLPLNKFDLVMFTLGYELSLNGVLLMLDTGNIPLHCSGRNDDHPVIIAGGPVVSNPLPFAPFIDAFWIGEAEAGFFDLVQILAKEKGRGAHQYNRDAILEKLSSHPNIYVKGKSNAKRAVYSGFSSDSETAIFPVPSMKIVQNHGTVEIMRGCPNGCRFCHAGFWYRPMRQKNQKLIMQQVNDMVNKGGWQQISLSSLSSGDYCGVSDLVDNLNNKYKDQHVSFQMPSLKVSGFTPDLLEKISVTRKSGLTFAVETPRDAWQMAINKEVTRDSVVSILEEAKKRGWKSAKFYFMIGLPNQGTGNREQGTDLEFSEEKEIVEFILDISKRSRMKFNINVGVFIPKPHTPYQWAEQIDSCEAKEKLYFIRSALKPLGHKVSTGDLLISEIEGLLSRGDERAGLLCEKAYLGGSRLDAWDEYINKDKWEEVLREQGTGSREQIVLPWSCIDSCVNEEYFKCELEKSENNKKTSPCSENCTKCGVCNKDLKIIKNSLRPQQPCASAQGSSIVNNNKIQVNNSIYRLIFSFSKQDTAVFYSHLSLIEIFSMSFRRAGIPVMYTQGFNPLAKMEFASPLTTGLCSDNEIALVDFLEKPYIDAFTENLNKNLPDGIRISRAECFYIPHGIKQHSLASLLWGVTYKSHDNNMDFVPAQEEKKYRQGRLENDCKSLLDLRRLSVLARNRESYFDVYRSIYNA